MILRPFWKDVPGYKGYYRVSRTGKVRSLPRWIEYNGRWGPARYFKPGRVLNLCLNKVTGYHFVNLWKGNKQDVRHVHSLVLEAFVGPCPPGMECRHYPDPDRTNNNLENLSWGTPQKNADDRVEHGTAAKALSPKKVRKIRRMFATGRYTKAFLARRFKVGEFAIYAVVTRRTWKHVA
jgi:hypothetical protein